MSNDAESLLVVVPVREFSKGISRFVSGWRDALKKLGQTPHFAIIDDGGSEPTVSEPTDDVTVIRNDAKAGLGHCLRQALETQIDHNKSPVFIIVPEYGYRPSDASELFNIFKDVDMVIGVRTGLPVPPGMALIQSASNFLKKWLFGIPEFSVPPWYGWAMLRRRWTYRFKYGPRLQDPDCGLLLVKRLIIDRCPIQSDGRFAMTELIVKANFLSAMMAEVSMSKPSDMPVMKGRFEANPQDERRVFHRPTFLPVKVEPSAPEMTHAELPS